MKEQNSTRDLVLSLVLTTEDNYTRHPSYVCDHCLPILHAILKDNVEQNIAKWRAGQNEGCQCHVCVVCRKVLSEMNRLGPRKMLGAEEAEHVAGADPFALTPKYDYDES